jgi:FixJ family two-component response regulator
MIHKIMVIERSNLLRMRIIKLLQESGFKQVMGYTSAELIGTKPQAFLSEVDLVIADIHLVGMSGIELMQKVHQIEGFETLPFILMSQSSDMKTINQAAKAGAIDFIAKPFENKLMIERVKKVLIDSMPNVYKKSLFDQREYVEKMITTEYERAIRGKTTVSFIKFKTDNSDLNYTIQKTQLCLRKIDTVASIAEEIYVALPLADENGLEVVCEKIKKHLKTFKTEVTSCHLFLFLPESEKRLQEMLDVILEESLD